MPFEPEYIATDLTNPMTLMQAWECINDNMLALQTEIIAMDSEIAVLENEVL
jgi:hypothetical protein